MALSAGSRLPCRLAEVLLEHHLGHTAAVQQMMAARRAVSRSLTGPLEARVGIASGFVSASIGGGPVGGGGPGGSGGGANHRRPPATAASMDAVQLRQHVVMHGPEQLARQQREQQERFLFDLLDTADDSRCSDQEDYGLLLSATSMGGGIEAALASMSSIVVPGGPNNPGSLGSGDNSGTRQRQPATASQSEAAAAAAAAQLLDSWTEALTSNSPSSSPSVTSGGRGSNQRPPHVPPAGASPVLRPQGRLRSQSLQSLQAVSEGEAATLLPRISIRRSAEVASPLSPEMPADEGAGSHGGIPSHPGVSPLAIGGPASPTIPGAISFVDDGKPATLPPPEEGSSGQPAAAIEAETRLISDISATAATVTTAGDIAAAADRGQTPPTDLEVNITLDKGRGAAQLPPVPSDADEYLTLVWREAAEGGKQLMDLSWSLVKIADNSNTPSDVDNLVGRLPYDWRPAVLVMIVALIVAQWLGA